MSFTSNVLLSTNNDDLRFNLSHQQKYKNLHIKNWVPIEYAHKNSDLVICHGGHVSCMSLFKYSVPGIILATHTEREYNARLVQELKAGILIEKKDYSKAAMEHAISLILEDKNYFNTVNNYSNLINSHYQNGEVIAANHILSLLERDKIY